MSYLRLQSNKELGEKYGIHPRDVESKQKFREKAMFSFELFLILNDVLSVPFSKKSKYQLVTFRNVRRQCFFSDKNMSQSAFS